MSPLPQVVVHASQISTATVVVVVQPSATNMAPGHVIKVAWTYVSSQFHSIVYYSYFYASIVMF